MCFYRGQSLVFLMVLVLGFVIGDGGCSAEGQSHDYQAVVNCRRAGVQVCEIERKHKGNTGRGESRYHRGRERESASRRRRKKKAMDEIDKVRVADWGRVGKKKTTKK